MRTRVFWPRMAADVADYVNQCTPCKLQKTSKQTKHGKLKLFPAHKPWEVVHVDIVGPYPTTSQGNKFILSAICRFSRFCELTSMPDMKASTCAQAFLNSVVTRYGVPRTIITDRGKQFSGTLWAAIMESTHIRINGNNTTPIRHAMTTSMAPQTNGAVERMHRVLRSTLAILAREYNQEWDTLLQYCAYAFRTSQHASTGMSPYEIVFGQPPTLAFDRIFEHPGQPENHTKQGQNNVAKFNKVWQLARSTQHKTDQRKKRNHDRTHKSVTFSPGERVILFTDQYAKGSRKLQTPFSEWVVLGMPSPLTVRIKQPITNRTQLVDVRRLSKMSFATSASPARSLSLEHKSYSPPPPSPNPMRILTLSVPLVVALPCAQAHPPASGSSTRGYTPMSTPPRSPKGVLDAFPMSDVSASDTKAKRSTTPPASNNNSEQNTTHPTTATRQTRRLSSSPKIPPQTGQHPAF